MPSSRDDESRRRYKYDLDRDPESTNNARDKPRSSHHKSSSKIHLPKRNSSNTERTRDRDSPKSMTAERIPARKVVSMAVPEMERRSSGGEVKPTSSYPSFSKAHSREAIGSREDIGNVKSSPFTPDTTELSEGKRRRNSTPANPNGVPNRAPPSPPLTAEEPDIRRSGSQSSIRRPPDDVKERMERGSKSMGSTPNGVKNAKSGTSLRREAQFGESEVSSMPGAFPDDDNKSTPNNSTFRRTVSTGSHRGSSTFTDDNTDSDATSVAPDRKPNRTPNTMPNNFSSPPPTTGSRARTPAMDQSFTPSSKSTPTIDVGTANRAAPWAFGTPTTAKQMPPPPPPPPPPVSQLKQAPRVDYLIKNGGLTSPVPKRLVSTTSSAPVQSYNIYQSPALNQSVPMEEYAKVFSTIHNRLDDYLYVLNRNGSLAVATGYKSVARRLLDKLSQVFARDISSQRCDCVVCSTIPQPIISDDEDSGLSWGEILEFVSGRQELPQWPPFTIQADDSGLGISGATQTPMQKLDIDVPEEYREHYIRQNQKTKRAVQTWLSQQPDLPSSPPEEADEDTLMFAMMTKLTLQQRNLFIALMHGQSFVSESRAPTPAERPSTSSNALRRARKALQRLYRLDTAPRDCESAMYLLNQPHLHGMLATLAEVNEAEWEILISGRFDGFLWSGAEAPFPPSVSQHASQNGSRVPSRASNAAPFSRNTTPFSGMSGMGPSCGNTPFSPLRNAMLPGDALESQTPSMFPSRGPTPGPNGIGIAPPAPVQMDEDTEIAVAAELERNLFLDMERLEDAFEVLHGRAELVRQMLRERSAGLAAQAQLRRGSGVGDPIGVRLDTPASGVTDFEDSEEDDGLGDLASVAPDDSASQISVSRRHRHRRERKTPVHEAVPEETESVFEEHERTRNGRRSKY